MSPALHSIADLRWRQWRRVIVLLGLLLALNAFLPAASGAFGLTTSTNTYTVDTGAGLVFRVRRTDNGSNTQSAGDLMSLVYNGVEYQDQSRGSHINSGFDFLYTDVSAVSVSAAVVNTDYIRVTVVAGDLTHYYLARRGYPNITMATYFTSEPSTLGLCRYIVRIPADLLPNGPVPSDIRDNTGAIESADIFGMADGTTRSKHYSNMRLKDWSHIGATGTNVGIWMVRSNHEGDSGGPFYRSLLNQCGSDQEITYIINYGETQTEPFRTSILNGPYTLAFTNGTEPAAIDNAWVANMGLVGFVGTSGRGTVSGSGINGRDTRYAYTVGFANSQAQYWTDAAASNGSFTSPGMLPGTYTLSVHKDELVVYTASVTVNAGATTSLNPIALTGDPSTTVPLWRIGNWDGSPREFLNGDKVTTMHPSDVRMAPWVPGPYVIGTSAPATGMPCYQWKDVNGGQQVQFELAANQRVASTIRIGITVAFEGARPKINVNSWASSNPSPSSQPETRSLTVGSYRGNNVTYTFSVPASAFVTGTNTMTIYPISGSGSTGFLSAGFSLDCIEMFQGTAQTLAVPNPPAVSAVSGNGQITLNWPASAGAAHYTVERASTPGGPYEVLELGHTGTSYIDAGLRNGIPYYYVVTASNSSGTGVPSAEVGAAASGPLFRAHLRFDEASGNVAIDSLNQGWDGTLVNGPTRIDGRINQAINLDGANDHVVLPTGITTGLGDFTIAAWVKLNTVSTWSRVFDFGTGTDRYMFLTPRAGVSNKVRFAITNGGNGTEQQIEGTAALPSGTWTHVAVTLSGSTGTLYVNGAAVGTNAAMTLAPYLLGATTQNYLGRSQYPDPYLNGAIDDFRVYGRPLSASEITSLASPPAPPTGITATGGDAQVALSWSASPGATSYSVQRALTLDGTFSVIASNISGTTYTNTGLTNGTTYYYRLVAGNGVTEGSLSATISAKAAQTFAQWRAAIFPGQNDPLIIGPTADPDRDGRGNQVEYFQATNPFNAEQGGPLTFTRDSQGNLIVSFRMAKNLASTTYVLQQSVDLATWSPAAVQPSIISDQGTYYLMQATIPSAGSPKVFLRLAITAS